MKNQTKSKKKYIDLWNGYIDELYSLCLTPSRELSEEVKVTIDKLKEFIPKVARDKGLGSKK